MLCYLLSCIWRRGGFPLRDNEDEGLREDPIFFSRNCTSRPLLVRRGNASLKTHGYFTRRTRRTPPASNWGTVAPPPRRESVRTERHALHSFYMTTLNAERMSSRIPTHTNSCLTAQRSALRKPWCVPAAARVWMCVRHVRTHTHTHTVHNNSCCLWPRLLHLIHNSGWLFVTMPGYLCDKS